jgi:hypothetical protein
MNDEALATNGEGSPNAQMTKGQVSSSQPSWGFVIVSSFVIRHSSFSS